MEVLNVGIIFSKPLYYQQYSFACNYCTMKRHIVCLILSVLLTFDLCFSSNILTLNQGSSLVQSRNDQISSENGVFTAGFYSVGPNAYCFSIWFTQQSVNQEQIIVWMAKRDYPVNGKETKISLTESGELHLIDAGQQIIWRTNTESDLPVSLQLKNNGNLVVQTPDGDVIWQSFDSPTNTLLPGQFLTRNTKLVSSRSGTNHSSGYYKLFFDNDNVLRLLYDGPDITSAFWPAPWEVPWVAGRSSFNNSKLAVLDSAGLFLSSDDFSFKTTDYGATNYRRLILDVDGNARVYSLDQAVGRWNVTWQALVETCRIHGICGANSLCNKSFDDRRCSCLPGYKMKDQADWSLGCEPDFKLSCNDNVEDDVSEFLQLPHVEFYGYDAGHVQNCSYSSCAKLCLENCNCNGFQHTFQSSTGLYDCFPKFLLFNGRRADDFQSPTYIRLPKANITSYKEGNSGLHCERDNVIALERSYHKHNEQKWVKPLIWATSALGVVELICVLIFLYKTKVRSNGATIRRYIEVATGFERFTYVQLKKATNNFNDEIGRGGGGIVYKGTLPDNRVVAVKCLKLANQEEAEFLTEVSTIGKLNHKNVINLWGYCAEGKHRMLVYEYMQHGSLAKNLYSDELDWEKRYEIAVGTAKGLAYLHDECLEWVLHCDVKPQNILLDSMYRPKVADFGVSRLINRDGKDDSKFSKIRGTRGYMAPEWVSHLPITSKVDVYSYGIVILELVTGKNPNGTFDTNGDNYMDSKSLIIWVKEKMQEADENISWIQEIIDPCLNDDFDIYKMGVLIKVAMQCVEDNIDARPTMNQVVNLLLSHNNDETTISDSL
ncbi:hypothetical protein LIER_39473 [Lithospermum erythrorhizon]|uniref:Receptor-like serine/threonine-protein kinase n=1 Tax=Lithospermum erythrorhizon TaxID=34254 RepID=A0AAV3QHY4_LITER